MSFQKHVALLVPALLLAASSARAEETAPEAAAEVPEKKDDAEAYWWRKPVVAPEPPTPKPWDATFVTHAALAGGNRAFHGSFGLTLGSQKLGPVRPSGSRRFTSFGGTALVRAYAPSEQIGCTREIARETKDRVCPVGWSFGPTLRTGRVKDKASAWTIPEERLEVAVTPFVGSEPLRAHGERAVAVGGRVTLGATFPKMFEKASEGSGGDGQGKAMAFALAMPLLLLNHVEIYAEPMVVGGKPYASGGLGVGFGL